jgi:hypothetical protein
VRSLAGDSWRLMSSDIVADTMSRTSRRSRELQRVRCLMRRGRRLSCAPVMHKWRPTGRPWPKKCNL